MWMLSSGFVKSYRAGGFSYPACEVLHIVMGWHSQCAAASMQIDCGVLAKASKHLALEKALPAGRLTAVLVFAARDRVMGMCWGGSALLCRMRGQQASA